MTELGGSAVATVYRATEVDTGRPVALKILKVDAVQPPLLDSFNHEMQTLARVSDHPNIVTLYRSLTTADGRPALVLELCRESLAQQLQVSGPLSARQVTRIGIKVAGALETAHRCGFLHRDMKPQNILVTQFGEPALSDFGVGALEASAWASAGSFGFTTLHAAPEMLEGHDLSPATDVYGLASTMYQLLTGSAPFASFENEPPASVILRIIRDPVRPLRAAEIPIGLSDVLDGALAKDAQQRPVSALAFADALAGVEKASGWTPTVYVAWDEHGPITAQAAVDPAPAVSGAPVQLYGPAPSVQSQRRPPPGAARERPALVDLPWGPPPPPRPARIGPSVAAPEAAARHVIGPEQPGRGHDSPRQPAASTPPLRPLQLASYGTSPPAPRPVFVDPPAPTASNAAPVAFPVLRLEPGEESAHPDAAGVAGSLAAGALPSGAAPTSASPLLIGAIAAAMIVVVAAVLLIAGVL
jgi:serine/threonine-protein kinase PknK